MEQLDTEKVVNLEQEAGNFLIENRLGAADFMVDEYDLLFRRQESEKVAPPAMFGAVVVIMVIASAENVPKIPFSLSRFEYHYVKDGERIEAFSLALEIGNPVPNGRVHHRVCVLAIRNSWVLALEEVLVNAALVVEDFEGCLLPFGVLVNDVAVEGFVIHAAHAENHSQIRTLGEKNVVVNEPKQIDLLIQRARLTVALEGLRQPKHGVASESVRERISSGRTACAPSTN